MENGVNLPSVKLGKSKTPKPSEWGVISHWTKSRAEAENGLGQCTGLEKPAHITKGKPANISLREEGAPSEPTRYHQGTGEAGRNFYTKLAV